MNRMIEGWYDFEEVGIYGVGGGIFEFYVVFCVYFYDIVLFYFLF